MFISHNYKLLFFEVPRTGSRSISQALMTLDPRSPTAIVRAVKRNLHHYHVYEQSMVDKYADYHLIAAHRNPYARLRSHFLYRKQHGNPDELKAFSFQNYLEWVCLDKLPFEIGPAMIDRPITELLPFADVDHWLRFDKLDDDWRELGSTMNIELPYLNRINRSKTDLVEDGGYSEVLAEMVYARFIQDFQQFGYAKNSWL